MVTQSHAKCLFLGAGSCTMWDAGSRLPAGSTSSILKSTGSVFATHG